MGSSQSDVITLNKLPNASYFHLNVHIYPSSLFISLYIIYLHKGFELELVEKSYINRANFPFVPTKNTNGKKQHSNNHL
jgi:hypothetical protein